VRNDELITGDLVDDRDRAVDAADKLTNALCELLGVDPGEHSSMNDPWQNALSIAARILAVQPTFGWAAEYTKFDGSVKRQPADERQHAILIVDSVRQHLASLNEPTRREAGVSSVHVVSRLTRTLDDGTQVLGPWLRMEHATPASRPSVTGAGQ